jgi:hypothetical protein
MSNLPPPDPRSSDGWNQQPYATPYSPQMAVNPYENESTPILVTGILSLVLCGPIGIYAWLKGNELRDRAQNAGWPEPGTAKVGRILGMVGTIIFGISIVFAILWFVFVFLIIGTTATTAT